MSAFHHASRSTRPCAHATRNSFHHRTFRGPDRKPRPRDRRSRGCGPATMTAPTAPPRPSPHASDTQTRGASASRNTFVVPRSNAPPPAADHRPGRSPGDRRPTQAAPTPPLWRRAAPPRQSRPRRQSKSTLLNNCSDQPTRRVPIRSYFRTPALPSWIEALRQLRT